MLQTKFKDLSKADLDFMAKHWPSGTILGIAPAAIPEMRAAWEAKKLAGSPLAGRAVTAPPVKASAATLQVTAYHESAHAVIANMFWGSSHTGEINIYPDGSGTCEDQDPWNATESERIVVSLSGPVASSMIQSQQRRRPDQWLAPGDSQDRKIISAKLGRQVRAVEWDEHEKQANAMVNKNWHAIEAVASELMKKGSLPAADVVALIDQAAYTRACQYAGSIY